MKFACNPVFRLLSVSALCLLPAFAGAATPISGPPLPVVGAPSPIKIDPKVLPKADAPKLQLPVLLLKAVEPAKAVFNAGETGSFKIRLASPAKADSPSCNYGFKIDGVDGGNLQSQASPGTDEFTMSIAANSPAWPTKAGSHKIQVVPDGKNCFNTVEANFNLAIGDLGLPLVALKSLTPESDSFDPANLGATGGMRFKVGYTGFGKCDLKIFVDGLVADGKEILHIPSLSKEGSLSIEVSDRILARIAPDKREGTHRLSAQGVGSDCKGEVQTEFKLLKTPGKITAVAVKAAKLSDPVQVDVHILNVSACDSIDLNINGKSAVYAKLPKNNGNWSSITLLANDPIYPQKESNTVTATGAGNCQGSSAKTDFALVKKDAKDIGQITRVSIANPGGDSEYGYAAGKPLQLRFDGKGTCTVTIHYDGNHGWKYTRDAVIEMPVGGGSRIWKSDFSLSPYGHVNKGVVKDEMAKQEFLVTVIPSAVGCVAMPLFAGGKATCYASATEGVDCKP